MRLVFLPEAELELDSATAEYAGLGTFPNGFAEETDRVLTQISQFPFSGQSLAKSGGVFSMATLTPSSIASSQTLSLSSRSCTPVAGPAIGGAASQKSDLSRANSFCIAAELL
jgi:hypothetical protein